MKEKVILTKANGEIEERKVIAHFKSLDEARPNIKDVPILILDKNEMNNGNNVLEFMWQKDGVYQAVNDENAWSELKATIVDIIKNNAQNISYISDENVKTDIGAGRSLGLTVAQTDALTANFKTLAVTATPVVESTPVIESTPAVDMPSVVPTDVATNNVISEVPSSESVTPVVSDVPVSEAPVIEQAQPVDVQPVNTAPVIENPVVSEPVNPVVDTPVVSQVVEQAPVESGVEIVSEEKETDFDKMQKEIEAATREYQEKIESIVNAYKKKINETINEANSLKAQANDHLKNAQAAEQIATMAYQNSVGVSEQAPSLELQKIA